MNDRSIMACRQELVDHISSSSIVAQKGDVDGAVKFVIWITLSHPSQLKRSW